MMDLYICTACNRVFTEEEMEIGHHIEPHGERWTDRYCPHCGAQHDHNTEIEEFNYWELDTLEELEEILDNSGIYEERYASIAEWAEIYEYFDEIRTMYEPTDEEIDEMAEEAERQLNIGNPKKVIGAQ